MCLLSQTLNYNNSLRALWSRIGCRARTPERGLCFARCWDSSMQASTTTSTRRLGACELARGRSRLDRFDFDMARYYGFDIDIASIFRAPNPCWTEILVTKNVSVSIGSMTLRFRSEPSLLMIEAQPALERCLRSDSAWTRSKRFRAARSAEHSTTWGRAASSRGWRNTVGNLIELLWLSKTYVRVLSTGICNNRAVRFHRIQDFKQYYFISIPPTPRSWRPR